MSVCSERPGTLYAWTYLQTESQGGACASSKIPGLYAVVGVVYVKGCTSSPTWAACRQSLSYCLSCLASILAICVCVRLRPVFCGQYCSRFLSMAKMVASSFRATATMAFLTPL